MGGRPYFFPITRMANMMITVLRIQKIGWVDPTVLSLAGTRLEQDYTYLRQPSDYSLDVIDMGAEI